MKGRFIWTAIVLGLVSAVGPFAIDMYIPALPSIGASLHASPAAVQASLTVYFVAIGLCQLLYGPAADRFGRKPPLYFGLVLFCIGSIGCALAPNIGTLIACRAVQAIGACAGSVVPRAIVRDLHTGPEATRLLALLLLVFSISPILAPLTGSLILATGSWRGIFLAVTAAALCGLVLTATQIDETLSTDAARPANMRRIAANYVTLLKDRSFLQQTFIGAFIMSGFFIYLGCSSFVIIGHYGLSPTAYSAYFAVNAIAFIGSAQFSGHLTRRLGLMGTIRLGLLGYATITVGLLAAVALGLDNLNIIAAFLFLSFACVGVTGPASSVSALEEHGERAGTASALMGALQMVIGAVMMTTAGVLASGRPLPMVAGIALCATLAWAIARPALTAPRAAPGLEPAPGSAPAE